MTNYFAIFNRREQSGQQVTGQKFENATLAPYQGTAPVGSGMLEDALVLKLEGASLTTVAEAQRAVQHFYPGAVTGTPVIVTEAQFKES